MKSVLCRSRERRNSAGVCCFHRSLHEGTKRGAKPTTQPFNTLTYTHTRTHPIPLLPLIASVLPGKDRSYVFSPSGIAAILGQRKMVGFLPPVGCNRVLNCSQITFSLMTAIFFFMCVVEHILELFFSISAFSLS